MCNACLLHSMPIFKLPCSRRTLDALSLLRCYLAVELKAWLNWILTRSLRYGLNWTRQWCDYFRLCLRSRCRTSHCLPFLKDEHGVTLMRYGARGVNHFVLSDTKTRWGLQFLTLVALVAVVVVVVASFNIFWYAVATMLCSLCNWKVCALWVIRVAPQ